MQVTLQQLLISWHLHNGVASILTITLLLLILFLLSSLLYWIARSINKWYIIPLLNHRLQPHIAKAILDKRFIITLIRFIPTFVFLLGSPLLILQNIAWTMQLSHIVVVLLLLYLLYLSIRTLFILLDITNIWATQHTAIRHQPIKSYIQIIKIVLVGLGAIFAISIIVDKSPWLLLTGLGALSAVLLLVFKDTITGFVANIQVSAYDMVRIGDWITIPQYDVDGDVMDISVNTVKIRNFDKTVLTIPTNALIQSGVQNWRGMTESGGRRIKRAIHLDINTIRFCDEALLERLRNIQLLTKIINKKIDDITLSNKEHNIDTKNPINGRKLTNIGLFRYYIEAYLKSLSTINFSLTFLVRQLAPTETGLPLELYIFTNDTNWVRYEAIQADIFDHLLAALPIFELKIYQLDSVSGLYQQHQQ